MVTGQAPITLEWKITSGGTQIKTKDNTHNNWNKSYTSDKNKKMRLAYVRIKIHTSKYKHDCFMFIPSHALTGQHSLCYPRGDPKINTAAYIIKTSLKPSWFLMPSSCLTKNYVKFTIKKKYVASSFTSLKFQVVAHYHCCFLSVLLLCSTYMCFVFLLAPKSSTQKLLKTSSGRTIRIAILSSASNEKNIIIKSNVKFKISSSCCNSSNYTYLFPSV